MPAAAVSAGRVDLAVRAAVALAVAARVAAVAEAVAVVHRLPVCWQVEARFSLATRD